MANALSARLAKQASGDSESRYDPLLQQEQSLANISVEKISPDPNQPRKDLGDITGLADSIKEYGLMSPIIVQAISKDSYQIIAGERRFTACKRAGLKSILCIVRTVEEHRKFEYQLIENLHRKDLNPVEEAMSYKSLIDNHNLSQRELSKRLGQSASGINQAIRILDLPKEILDGVQTSEHITKSILLEIVKETDKKKQLRLWKRALDGTLTVRNARTAKSSGKGIPKPKLVSLKIQLEQGSVTVRFEGGKEPTKEEQIQLLAQAIEVLKSEISHGFTGK